jgi:NAD(P)-dependent dehydrogenase (short-subunit alcohol dehydrogenase family)
LRLTRDEQPGELAQIGSDERRLRQPVERQWRVARPGDQRRVVACALRADGVPNMRADSSNPARRIGTVDDVSGAVLFAMTNSFMTGVTLKIDGGEPLT